MHCSCVTPSIDFPIKAHRGLVMDVVGRPLHSGQMYSVHLAKWTSLCSGMAEVNDGVQRR
jgi:hypothetical protein